MPTRLNAVIIIYEPEGIGGTVLFIYGFVVEVTLWIVVAVAFIVTRGGREDKSVEIARIVP